MSATKGNGNWADLDDDVIVKKLPPLPGSAAATAAATAAVPPAAPAVVDAPKPATEAKDATTEPATPAAAPAATATATAAPAAAASAAAEKEEKEKTDVLVLGGMLAQLGGGAADNEPAKPSTSATDTKEKSTVAATPTVPEEQLHLIKPYESHVSEQMFTDECFKM